MARGTTLTVLLDMLRKEIKTSSDPSLSVADVGIYTNHLNRAQDFYHGDYDWPHLRVQQDKLTAAGQRYYDPPSNIDLERIQEVHIRWGGTWEIVERGIDLEHYNSVDSEEDSRLDPVLRWDVIDVGSGPQIEFWPIPATDDLKVRFTGIKKLSRLVDGSDQAVIDDNLIVLAAAAPLAAHYEQPDVEEKIAAAGRLYSILKARSTQRNTRNPNFAMGSDRPARRPHQIIAVHKE